MTVYGIPLDSNIYTPEVDEGRWFQPGEENVVLLHNSTADEIGVGVGDYVIFEDNVGHEIPWRVIGLFFDPGDIYIAIAPREAFSWSLGEVNVANSLRVQLAASDAESAQAMVDNLKEVFKLRSIEVTTLFGPNSGETIQEISENRLFAFNTILLLLMILAVLIAAVGGIGLSGMLSLSVWSARAKSA